MKISTLEQVTINELLECFNRSFSDYFFPFNLTRKKLENNLAAENVKMELSVGAFDDGRLIGFILQGIDEVNGSLLTYNAGTGVIPEKRGAQITSKLYEYLLPRLKAMNVRKTVLEVIEQNEKAFHIYSSFGYTTTRSLHCFKGEVSIKKHSQNFSIKPLENFDWKILRSFWDWQPSWQHSMRAVENLAGVNVSIGIYDDENLVGYLIYNPEAKRVHQFAVEKSYRNKGVAQQLFSFIAENHSPELTVINVDGNANATAFFLESIGLSCFIKQFEMELEIK
jgi:GNAT superfamily N-acetyltransferase